MVTPLNFRLAFLLLMVCSTSFGQQDAYLRSLGLSSKKKYAISDTTKLIKLNKTARDSVFSNAEKSQGYARLIIKVARQIEYIPIQIDGMLTLVNAKIFLNEVDSAMYYAKKSLNLAKKHGEDKRIIFSYEAMGNVHFFTSSYDDAAKAYLNAIKIGERINFPELSRSYGNLGLVFMKTGNVRKAQEYFNLTYNQGEVKKDTTLMTFALNNLGLIEKNKRNYAKATAYFEEGIDLARAIKLDHRLAELLHNMAIVHFQQGDNKAGMTLFEESMEISKDNGSFHSLAMNYMALGLSLSEMGRTKDAIDATAKAIDYGLKAKNKEYLTQGFLQSANLYSDIGDYYNAYTYMTHAFAYRDSVNMAEINNAISNAESKYAQDKKDLKVKMERAQEKKISDEKLWWRDLMLWISGIVLMLVALGIFMLYKSNRQIKLKNRTVEQQKSEIELQHKEITDSIQYAKRIQNAIISNADQWKKLSEDSWVLFRPKDVVSGDFHWVYNEEEGDFAIWAVADCTGHGVPGAFMSMLGVGFLNEIIIEDKMRDPGKILDALRRKIIKSLENEKKESTNDGMDIALCVYNKSKRELSYAGANNGLWLLGNSSGIDKSQFKEITFGEGDRILAELAPDKMPIGKGVSNPPGFHTRTIKVNQGDTVVLYSDGFADQFGGVDNKKFKYKQLKECLLQIQHLSVEEQHTHLEKTFDSWKSNNEQTDDVCMASVKL